MDISDVTIDILVVNFDASEDAETHARRICRAERGAGSQRKAAFRCAPKAITLLMERETGAVRHIIDTMICCGQQVSDHLMTIAEEEENCSWDSNLSDAED